MRAFSKITYEKSKIYNNMLKVIFKKSIVCFKPKI